MTEIKQKFRVKQNLNINGMQRTVEFAIEEIDENIEQIVLQVTENNARTLAIGVIREIVTGEDNKKHNKFNVNIDRFASTYETHLLAEVVDSEKDFFWFNIPVNNLTAMLHERGFEALVNEFTRDLTGFLSKYITVKKDEK
jgi:stress response protein SCP2